MSTEQILALVLGAAAAWFFLKWRLEVIERTGWDELAEEYLRQRDYWARRYGELAGRLVSLPEKQSSDAPLSQEKPHP